MTLVGGFDFESTGVDPNEDRIVEVALKVVELETGKTVLSFQRRINPDRHIPEGAVRIHGIADADVVGAPRFKDIAVGFAALMGKVDILVAHNGEQFDLPLLKAELQRAGVEVAHFPPLFDTMLHCRWATIDGKIPSLGELCFALDVDYDTSKAHAAMYDVDVMLDAFRSGWKLGRIQVPGVPASTI